MKGKAGLVRNAGNWLPWIALAMGFSPVLADLAQDFVLAPEDRANAVAWVLLLWSAVESRELPGRGRVDGTAPLAGAIVLEGIGIAANSWSIARFGLALGVVGLARLRGFPPLGVAALAFFAIPLPDFVASSPSPHLESALASLASWIARSVGLGVEAVGAALQGPAGRLDLVATDGGLVLAHLLGAVGWFAGLRAGASLLGLLARSAAWSILALPAQAMGMVGAAIAVGAGVPGLGGWWLGYGLWPVVCVVGVLIAWHPFRRRDRPT